MRIPTRCRWDNMPQSRFPSQRYLCVRWPARVLTLIGHVGSGGERSTRSPFACTAIPAPIPHCVRRARFCSLAIQGRRQCKPGNSTADGQDFLRGRRLFVAPAMGLAPWCR